MAENDASKPTTAKPTKTSQVGGRVTLKTATRDPRNVLLLDRAVDAFKAQLAETHGAGNLSNVAVTLAEHKIGESATYDVTGELAA